MLKVRNENLVLIAGLVWLAAGVNIVRLGLGAYASQEWMLPAFAGLLAGSAAVFVAFHLNVFNKMVDKHVRRILGFAEEKSNVFKFFDARGYVMMAIMMGGGVALRASGLLPGWFIAFFYTGIGLALSVAGISFIGRYVRNRKNGMPLPCPLAPRTWRA